jgi:hypothetical protein
MDAGAYTSNANDTNPVTIRLTNPDGREIPKGRWIIINAPKATVTIANNIIYTDDALQTTRDIPQVVIIANRINILGDVERVDAWLIATGEVGAIYTCADVAAESDLRANNCGKQLTVNGPVVTRHLYLWRTSGASPVAQIGEPAEIFNLRPDAYLWATAYNSSGGRLPTASTTELPPRF